MILFNWQKIIRVCKYKQTKILKLFYYISHNVIIKSRRDRIAPLILEKDYSGNSFLLNPIPIYSGVYTDLERVEYIALASLRSYSEYMLSGKVTLDLRFSPLSVEKIGKNRLLSIEQDQIVFKYEGKKE